MCHWQVGDSLEEFLVDATSDTKLRQCLMSLSEATRTIAFKVWQPLQSLFKVLRIHGPHILLSA